VVRHGERQRAESTMLIGEYTHTLDDKKRVAIPAKFRKELGKKMIVTRGLDACLTVYPHETWRKLSEKISALPMGTADSRSFGRFIFAGAVETDLDSLGRILIPDFLKEFADLKSKVVIAGLQDHAEIWDEKRWREYRGRIEKEADVLAEKLGDTGIL